MRIGVLMNPRAACVSAAVIWLNLLGAAAPAQEAAPQEPPARRAKPAWLEGEGKELRLRVTGQMFDAAGNAARDFTLKATLVTQFSRQELPAEIEVNRFRFRVPVGKPGWFR